MKKKIVTCSTIALCIVSLLYLSVLAGAVNSYCAAGPYGSSTSPTRKSSIDYAHTNLDDFYTSSYDQHKKEKYGVEKGDFLMDFQKYQPQHFLFFGDGIKNGNGRFGQIIKTHTDSHFPDERIWASNWGWWFGLHNDEKNINYYSPAPFSVIFYQSCGSFRQADSPNHMSANANDIGGFIFIGMWGNKATNGDGMRMIEGYFEKITDGKKSYRDAYKGGKAEMGKDRIKRAHPRFWCKSVGGMWHSPRYDIYTNIDSTHKDTSSSDIISKGNSKSLLYSRNFKGTTNGAYVVFHGFLNSDETDLNAQGSITIQIKRWNGSNWVLISTRSTTTWNVKNHDYDDTYYGGSDICSVYIRPSDITDYLLITASFNSNDQNTDEIQINRMELMEIGSK